MKVCENCGIEIGGRDGVDQLCPKCEACDGDKRKLANRRHNEGRRARDQAMRDLGLVKVHGALGGTYWE